LLDEIEKAHPEVINILLQVLEDGRLTDYKGLVVYLRNTILFMTYNVGANQLEQIKLVGLNFEEECQKHKDMKYKVTNELKRTFRPEFLNRIDETIVLHSLKKKHMKDIVSLMIKEVQNRMESQEMNFTITDGAIEKIAEEGFDPEYGARPLRRS